MCGNSLGVWRRAVSALDPLLASPPYLLGWRAPKEGAVVPTPSRAYRSCHPGRLEPFPPRSSETSPLAWPEEPGFLG